MTDPAPSGLKTDGVNMKNYGVSISPFTLFRKTGKRDTGKVYYYDHGRSMPLRERARIRNTFDTFRISGVSI